MPLLSWVLTGVTSIASGIPYFSTATWIFTPLIFLPPSTPRSKQLGAERQERLSITTVLGSGVSPQASRQERRSRSSSRRHSPSRVQRANSENRVPNGMPESSPLARHCMPQKPTHQIAITVLRSSAPASAGLGPGRVGRVPSAAMAASSTRTSSMKAPVSENASQGAGAVFAGRVAVPICLEIRWLLTRVADIPPLPPDVTPYSSQSGIPAGTAGHDPSANRLL